MDNRRSQIPYLLLFSVLFGALAIFLIWSDPFQWVVAKGNNFIVQWLAVRTFAKESLSPYHPAVQTTTEEIVYGHEATSFEKGLKFSSPLYSVIVILPFALIGTIQTAQLTWMIILGMALIASTSLILRLTDWKPPVWLLFLVIAFTFLGFHNFQALASGSVVILSAVFVFAALMSIRTRRYELAGILLALATIQPRAILLVILFILIWSVSKRLWHLVIWFLAGVALLIILGLLFIPNWLVQYAQVIFNFKDYYAILNPVTIFSSGLPGMGRQLGWGLSLLMALVLLFEWVAARKRDFNWFLWTTSLTMIVSPWIGIPADPDDFVFFLLPLILILAAWDRRFLHFGKWMAVIGLVVLLFGLWGIFTLTYPDSNPIQQSQIFLFPLPFFLLVGLYWVRWWAVKPQIDYIEEIRSVDKF